MKFGETIAIERESSPWAPYYLDYESLKSILEEHQTDQTSNRLEHGETVSLPGSLGAEFMTQLHAQVERIVSFVLQEQGKIANELRTCRGELPTTVDVPDIAHANGRLFQTPPTPHHVQNDSLGEYSLQSLMTMDSSSNTCHNASIMEKLNALEDSYCQVGLHLLHLYHFVELNVTGIRKILKKHDKLLPRHKISVAWLSGGGSSTLHVAHPALASPRPGSLSGTGLLPVLFPQRQRLSTNAYGSALVQPLLRDECLGALAVMLEAGLQELYRYKCHPLHASESMQTPILTAPSNDTVPPPNFTSLAQRRLSFQHDRDHCPPLQSLLDDRRASFTEQHGVPPNVGGTDKKPLSVVHSATIHGRKMYRMPSSRRSRSFSLRVGSSQRHLIADADAILWRLQAARHRLHETSSFVHLLAAPMMLASPDEVTPSEEGDDDGAPLLDDTVDGIFYDDEAKEQRSIKLSSTLNLLSTSLYMCNYYIVAPSSVNYAQRLGGTAALASLIIGMTPVAALVSTVLYSWWTSYSYKSALIFASACSAGGNLLYAAGLPCNSLSLVMLGRLLNGFGSARSINRRYICDTFPRQERTAASAAFVTAGALGMAAGPAIASALHYVTTDKHGNDLNDSVYWQAENAPGWFMFGIWMIYLVCLVWFFEDPPKKVSHKKSHSSLALNKDEVSHLLGNGSSNALALKEPPIWRNIPVMITFTLYFVLKLILEGVLSASAVLTGYYFGWKSGLVGIYLACLGLLMLPANMCVAMLAQSYDDRELIIGIQVLMFAGCVLILQYTAVYEVWQYVLASVVLFISTNALEGPNMSLLSKTIPSSWSKGIFNVGLLATEAGTLGRAVGDVLLAVFGSAGLEHLLNQTFGSFSVLSLCTLFVSYYFYDHLEPLDERDD